jgi:hypothetical protein
VGRSRAETYRLMLAHKAAAGALEAALKNAAVEEYENERVRVTWDLPGGGQVIASLRHDAAVVEDPAVLLAWVKQFRPDQVQEIEQVRPAYVEQLLKDVVPHENPDDAEDTPEDAAPGTRFCVLLPGDGVLIPGVCWVKGGGLASVAVRNDRDAVKRMNLAAAAYAEGTGVMPGLESGEKHDVGQ